MKLDLLNNNSNNAIIFAGIVSIFIGVGIARFSFTSLLPLMLNDTISLKFAGFLATTNYVGYFIGSVFAIFLKDLHSKIQFFRLGLFFSIISTIILGLTLNETLWVLSRIIAGFATAMILVVCSSIVMIKLNCEDKTKFMGIYFSGIGSAITITHLFIGYINFNENIWQFSWLLLSLIATICSIYPLYILSIDTKIDIQAIKHKITQLSHIKPNCFLV
jgi:MFS family permease